MNKSKIYGAIQEVLLNNGYIEKRGGKRKCHPIKYAYEYDNLSLLIAKKIHDALKDN